MKRRLLSVRSTLVAIYLLLIPALGFAQDVILKRQDLMDSANEANKAIRAAAKQKDYATIEDSAREIAESMRTLHELFPKGSLAEKSEAHPDIWSKWDEFRKRQGIMIETAEALRKAAAAKDDAQVTAQLKAMGGMRSGACGGCHLSFNKKRMKKTPE